MSAMDNMMWEAKMFEHGRITVPKKVREGLGVEEGDKVVFKLDSDGNLKVGSKKVDSGKSEAQAEAA